MGTITPLSRARMPPDRDITLINDFRLRKGRLTKKGTRGKRRMTIEINAEVVAIDTSARNLGRLPAERVVQMVQADFAKIGQLVMPATLRQRGVNRRAYDAGKAWAKKRYRGQTRAKAAKRPDPDSTQWGVDSGLLRDSFRARYVESSDTWVVNVAGNRLLPDQFRNQAAYEHFLRELRRNVPALNPRSLASRREWKEALQEATDQAIIDLSARGRDLRRQRLKTQLGIVRNVLSLVG